VCGMVGAAIGDSVDMVGLQVGPTFLALERCQGTATLAHSIGSA
jgi:hypothetical protein